MSFKTSTETLSEIIEQNKIEVIKIVFPDMDIVRNFHEHTVPLFSPYTKRFEVLSWMEFHMDHGRLFKLDKLVKFINSKIVIDKFKKAKRTDAPNR